MNSANSFVTRLETGGEKKTEQLNTVLQSIFSATVQTSSPSTAQPQREGHGVTFKFRAVRKAALLKLPCHRAPGTRRMTPGLGSHVTAQQPLSAGACFALRDDFAHSTFLEKPWPRAPTTHSTREGLACSAQALRPGAAREIAAGPWRAAITHKPRCQEVSPLTWVRRRSFKRWACPLPAAWRVALQRAFQNPAQGKGEVKTPSEPPEMADKGRNDLGEGSSHHSKPAHPHAGLTCSSLT